MTRFLRHRPEEGSAMIVAISVVMVISLLMVYVADNALHQLSGTAGDRQRTLTVASAEGGVDLAVSQMQSATTLTGSTGLPCGIPGTLATSPTTATYTVTVTYYSSADVNLSSTGCPTASPTAETYYTGTTTPASATIFSKGASNSTAYGNQAMEADVQLSSSVVSSTIGNDAVYSAGAMTWQDGVTLGDINGAANVYSGGDFGCTTTPGTTNIQGSVYVQGSLTTTQQCNTTGDWWTLDYVSDHGPGSIVGGNITVSTTGTTFNCGGGYPTSSVCLNGNGSVGGTITAAGSVDNVHNESTGTIHANVGNTSAPPTQAFPQLNFVSSNWTASGWNVITEPSNGCTAAEAAVGAMNLATQPTVIYVPGTCQMTWSGDLSLNLAQNLVVFAEGGFFFQKALTVTAGSSATKLYLIAPYAKGDGGGGGTNTCGPAPGGWPGGTQTPGLYVGGDFTEPTSNFNTLLYAPCSVYMPGGFTADYAQIYGGTVWFNQPISFKYQAAPIPGYNSTGPNLLNVTLLYLRQVTNPSSTTGSSSPTSSTTSSTTTTSSSTTTTVPLSGLAGLGFTSTSLTNGATLLCSTPVSQNVTCTAQPLGGTGSFTGYVTLETSSGSAVTNNTGTALTVTSSDATVKSPGGTVSPSSSTIATGVSTTASAFTLTGLGGGWQATMTCSLVVNGLTYTIAVTGH